MFYKPEFVISPSLFQAYMSHRLLEQCQQHVCGIPHPASQQPMEIKINKV